MPLLPMIQPPEARGKAAAFDRWLAQGGGNPQRMGRGGRFPSGPMKGLTYDQAKQKFESMWGGASPAIKDKYAKRAAGDLAPSERPPVAPPLPADAMKASQKANRMGFYKRIGMAPATPATPAPPSGDLSKQAMGTPAQQAQVAAMMNEGAGYGTADTGDQSMKAAIAMDKYTGKPVSAPIEKTPVESAIDSTLAANNRFWDNVTGTVNSAITAPFKAPSEKIVDDTKAADYAKRQAEKEAADKAAQAKLTAENVAKGLGRPLPTPAPSTPATNPVTPPPAAASAPTPSAIPSITKPGRIGQTPAGQELVGMKSGVPQYAPIGEVYGQDAATKAPMLPPTDDQVRARYQSRMSGPSMQVGAQRTMESSGVTPVGSMTRNAPRAVPVVAPAPPTFAQRMRVTPGPKIANPDDPRKFFTGRVLPLDQLNNPSKAPSSGYQAGGIGPSGGRVLSVRPARR